AIVRQSKGLLAAHERSVDSGVLASIDLAKSDLVTIRRKGWADLVAGKPSQGNELRIRQCDLPTRSGVAVHPDESKHDDGQHDCTYEPDSVRIFPGWFCWKRLSDERVRLPTEVQLLLPHPGTGSPCAEWFRQSGEYPRSRTGFLAGVQRRSSSRDQS